MLNLRLAMKGLVFVFTSTSFFSISALAWGSMGHQIVAYSGAQLTTDGQAFWQANANGMRQLTTVPDRVWKALSTGSQERPTHFFQGDAYTSDANNTDLQFFPKSYADAVAQYGQSTITVNGTAPWRVAQFYALTVQALKSQNVQQALQYAGAMSHYIGDLSQPLHVSANYDGQQTGNNGIHSYFETTNLKDEMAIRADVLQRAQALLKDPQFLAQFNGDIISSLYFEAARSLHQRDQILDTDTKLGRTGAGAAAQLEIAKQRMADGAATLAIVLSRAWRDSGQTLNASPVAVSDPAWVPPSYNDFQFWSHPMSLIGEEADDCVK
ncbi:MAG: S1/P1 nuclease [Pseudobdellovibrio sp.]